MGATCFTHPLGKLNEILLSAHSISFFSSRIYTYITNLIMQLLITLSFSLSLSLFIYQNKDTIKVQLQTQKKANLGLVGTNKTNVN